VYIEIARNVIVYRLHHRCAKHCMMFDISVLPALYWNLYCLP